ncbi:hypothetical protein LCM10_06505 [Rossellomorea aquimaris]|uniref:hypothetical protein n=1 Tax=Rossellomorea aquimaris TaxID=189382 RepID=UPI001CD63CE7|nr:hypothetical protein [Rossellomorea aquimaris]MCA1054632.1 hypothetical protein [Rossellomorea aquimaris]
MNKYIIEDAECVAGDTTFRKSFLIEGHRIAAIRESFRQYNYVRMNVSPFIMTPTHVMCDTSLPVNQDFSTFKSYFMDHFITKGCTTILTSFTINYEYQFEEKLGERRTSLLSSPLDYSIGLKLKPHLITPELILQCKRKKVPVIWISLDDGHDLQIVKWGWIKGLLYDYPITFVPFFTTNMDKKQKMKHLKIWQKTMEFEKIPHLSYEIEQKVPLSLNQLKKIGLYPHRGNFHTGGEISYNLYMRKGKGEELLPDERSFHYENFVLKCTMNRGKYNYLNDQGRFHPGAGIELKVQTPGFFTA